MMGRNLDLSRCGCILSLLVAVILMAGCGSKVPANSELSAPAHPEATTAVNEPGREVDSTLSPLPLQVASWEETQAIIATHKGKIVVLDFWSTYCQPCIKELPGLGQLQERHKGDVVGITLNCNFNGIGSPDDERETILKVLSAAKTPSQNLISSDPDEELYKKVGIASVPVVQVYDRAGRLRKQIDNENDEYGAEGFTYAGQIAPYVADLITAVGK